MKIRIPKTSKLAPRHVFVVKKTTTIMILYYADADAHSSTSKAAMTRIRVDGRIL